MQQDTETEEDKLELDKIERESKRHFIMWQRAAEIVICKPEDEAEMLTVFFDKGNRDRRDYTRREVFEQVIVVTPRLFT